MDSMMAFPLTAMPQPGQILLSDGSLPAGMEYPELKLAVLTEGQLMARSEPKRKAKKTATNRQKLNSFTDLSPGDLVVHENYGIGRFVAMEQIRVDGAIKDYIKIAYQGTDTLFVPATQLDLVSKYIGSGGEDGNVKLNKIGTDTWQKTKTRARKAGNCSALTAIPSSTSIISLPPAIPQPARRRNSIPSRPSSCPPTAAIWRPRLTTFAITRAAAPAWCSSRQMNRAHSGSGKFF